MYTEYIMKRNDEDSLYWRGTNHLATRHAPVELVMNVLTDKDAVSAARLPTF